MFSKNLMNILSSMKLTDYVIIMIILVILSLILLRLFPGLCKYRVEKYTGDQIFGYPNEFPLIHVRRNTELPKSDENIAYDFSDYKKVNYKNKDKNKNCQI